MLPLTRVSDSSCRQASDPSPVSDGTCDIIDPTTFSLFPLPPTKQWTTIPHRAPSYHKPDNTSPQDSYLGADMWTACQSVERLPLIRTLSLPLTMSHRRSESDLPSVYNSFDLSVYMDEHMASRIPSEPVIAELEQPPPPPSSTPLSLLSTPSLSPSPLATSLFHPSGSVHKNVRSAAQHRTELIQQAETAINAHTAVEHAVVLFPRAGLFEGRMVALVTLHHFGVEKRQRRIEGIFLLDPREVSGAEAEVRTIHRWVQETQNVKPEGEPAVWILLAKMPAGGLEATRMTERRRLLSWLQNMNQEMYDCVIAMAFEPHVVKAHAELPAEPIESSAVVTDQTTINSHSTRTSVSTTVASQRSSQRQSSTTQPTDFVEFGKPFDLTPMQQLFFSLKKETDGPSTKVKNRYRHNRSFFFRLKAPKYKEEIKNALEALIIRHPSLRARFRYEHGIWKQRVMDEVAGSYRLCHHQTPDLEAIMELGHAAINLEFGPVFGVDHFYTNDNMQMLHIVAHWLVADLFSWKVIMNDLDCLLRGASLPPLSSAIPPHCSPQQEGNSFAKAVYNNVVPAELAVQHLSESLALAGFMAQLESRMHPTPEIYAYWGLDQANSTEMNVAQHTLQLEMEIALFLETAANNVFRTQPVEIYLTALLASFAYTFQDRQPPVIGNIETDRDQWLEVYGLVGNYDWIYPVESVSGVTDEVDLLKLLRIVKDMRRIRKKPARESFEKRANDQTRQWPAEITFTRVTSPMQLDSQEEQCLEYYVHPGNRSGSECISAANAWPLLTRRALFEVVALVDKDMAQITFHYPKQADIAQKVRSWASSFHHCLRLMDNRLRVQRPELTLCDITLPIGYDELQKFNKDVVDNLYLQSSHEVDDIVEISPLQQETLVRQLVKPESGVVSTIYRLEPSAKVPLNASRICEAWQTVVNHTRALRTVFVEGIVGDNLFHGVVLAQCTAELLFLGAKNVNGNIDNDAIMQLDNLPPLKSSARKPRHRLGVYETGGIIFLRLDINSAICDGGSVHLLMRDLLRVCSTDGAALTSAKVSDGASHRQYIAAVVAARSRFGGLSSLRKMIPQVPECQFPSLAHRSLAAPIHTSLYLPSVVPEQIVTFARNRSVSPRVVFKLAWALTLRVFTSLDRIAFGYHADSRDGIDLELRSEVGRFETILACIVDFTEKSTVFSILKRLEEQQRVNAQFAIFSLSEIEHASREGHATKRRSCVGYPFNSVVYFEDQTDYGLSSSKDDAVEVSAEQLVTREALDFDMVLRINFKSARTTLDISHRNITVPQTSHIANTFATAINCIISNSDRVARELNFFTQEDMFAIRLSQPDKPTVWPGMLHDLIVERCQSLGNAVAVTGWDGELTYNELDKASANVARKLTLLGAKSGMAIPAVFGHSIWATVAILGIMRTGAAFVPIDADNAACGGPATRRLPTNLVVCCREFDSNFKMKPHQLQMVVVDQSMAFILPSAPSSSLASSTEIEDLLPELPGHHDVQIQHDKPAPSSSHPAFILVNATTGATMEYSHGAASCAFKAQGPALGINRYSRVMQLCSFGSDIAVAEILTTLIAGATVCVPSAHERVNEFATAAQRMGVTFSYMTPLLSHRLEPSTLELKTVCFRTTSLDEGTWQAWNDAGIKILLAYGAPHICPLGISVLEVDDACKLRQAGKPNVGRFWIVSKDDHQKLVPLGALGELVVESAVLSKPSKFEGLDAFYHCRKGARTASPSQCAPTVQQSEDLYEEASLYASHNGENPVEGLPTSQIRTGHTARFIQDGNIELVEFQCSTIINNRSIILGEVEDKMRRFFGREFDVAVEAIEFSPQAGHEVSSKFLIAFIEFRSQFEGPDEVLNTHPNVRSHLAMLRSLVDSCFPSHSVPEIFVPIRAFPFTPSLKVDRRALRRMIAGISKSELIALSRPAKVPEAGSTAVKPLNLIGKEQSVSRIWAQALSIPKDMIRRGDDFMSLGGDQVLAINAVLRAARQGLYLPLVDILSSRTVAEVAKASKIGDATPAIQSTLSPWNFANIPIIVEPKPQTPPSATPSPERQHPVLTTNQDVPQPDPPAKVKTTTLTKSPCTSDDFVAKVLAPKVGISNVHEIKDQAPANMTQIWALEDALFNSQYNVDWFTIEFPGPVSSRVMKDACTMLVTIHPILRTGFAMKDRQVWQLVYRSWTPAFKVIGDRRTSYHVEKEIQKDRLYGAIDQSKPATSFCLVHSTKSAKLMVRLAKTQYDSNSLRILLEDLISLYAGATNPPRRQSFCEYLRAASTKENSNDSLLYWSKLLEGAKMTHIVSRGRPLTPEPLETICQRVPIGSLGAISIGINTIVKCAWAIILGSLTATGDVVFGEVVTGRAAGQGTAVMGPCSKIVPVRVRFKDEKMSALELMETMRAQGQASAMHETVDWIKILESSTDWPYWTSFGSIVATEISPSVGSGDIIETDGLTQGSVRMRKQAGDEWNHTDMLIKVKIEGASASVQLTYTNSHITAQLAARALSDLCLTLAMISSSPTMSHFIPSKQELAQEVPVLPVKAAPYHMSNLVQHQAPKLRSRMSMPSLMTEPRNTFGKIHPALLPAPTNSNGVARDENHVDPIRLISAVPMSGHGSADNTDEKSSQIAASSRGAWRPSGFTTTPLTAGNHANKNLAPETRLPIQALIMSAWTAHLDHRKFGVPENQLYTTPFYDIWGSLLPAAAVADYINRELPLVDLPLPGGFKNASTTAVDGRQPAGGIQCIRVPPEALNISMSEIIAYPSVSQQIDLVARKISSCSLTPPARSQGQKNSLSKRAGSRIAALGHFLGLRPSR